jgi:hypothetical protein
VGEVRRRVDRSAVRFDLRPWRPLTAAERRSIDDAADRCGTFLGLPAEVVLC